MCLYVYAAVRVGHSLSTMLCRSTHQGGVSSLPHTGRRRMGNAGMSLVHLRWLVDVLLPFFLPYSLTPYLPPQLTGEHTNKTDTLFAQSSSLPFLPSLRTWTVRKRRRGEDGSQFLVPYTVQASGPLLFQNENLDLATISQSLNSLLRCRPSAARTSSRCIT
jgi:hypothetical protein